MSVQRPTATEPRVAATDSASSSSAETAAPDPRFSVARMDPSTPPTVDFYAYANGRWLRENPVPADKVRWGAFDELLQQNYRVLREILEQATATPDPPGSVRRQVGDFFRSAMDTTSLERARFGPIQTDLERADAIHSVGSLFQVWASLHRDGFEGLFENYVYPDKRQSEIYAFYLDQGGLSLPDRDYYLDPKFAEVLLAYRAHLERTFRAIGDHPDRAAKAAAAVLEIETALARVSRTKTELRDEERNYNRVDVAPFVAAHPTVPFAAYLADRELRELPYLVVGQPEFFGSFDRLIQDRPLADWKEYTRWQIVRNAAPFLHEAAEAEDFDFFHRTLLGQQAPEPRWKRGAITIDQSLGEALGALYVERAFPAEARSRMRELVEDLKSVFRDRLADLPWMSPETRQRALAKFAAFGTKIGHPDQFRDYSSVRIADDDYLGNVRRARAFEVHRQVARVGGPVDRTEWGMTPPTVNAYFSPVKNEIVFPAGILQPPFFDVTVDDAVNYGGIGAVIGHEITHGYDDQGRKFDAKGNLQDWWTSEDAQEFRRRAQQVVEEYNQYAPLPGLHLNGELTLGENLADLGGLSIAYEALQRRLAREPKARRAIDGLSPEQRFFLSWAQVWRQNCREPETRRRVLIDPHSPGEFRALGAAANLNAFYGAFGISEGQPMWRPPERRVSVW